MRRHLWLIFLMALLAIPVSAQFRRKAPSTKPAKTPNQAAAPATKPVDLAVEPEPEERLSAPATLRAAAEANDFDSFDALYQRAARRRESLGAYTDLHEVWSYAQQNPAGSFFGSDMYARIAARYPEYARFIREYRVVDRSGVAFYPTRETRAFLLAQAIAEVDPIESKPSTTKTAGVAAPSKVNVPDSHAAKPATVKREASAGPIASKPEGKDTDALQHATPVHIDAAMVPDPPPSSDALRSDIAESSTDNTRGEGDERDTAPAPPYTAASALTGGGIRGIFLLIAGMLGIGFILMTLQAPTGPRGDGVDGPHEAGSQH